jgi:cupin superfamily acireductone dioxygenase involved in methionine salvage
MNSELYIEFNTWADRILSRHASDSVVAYIFNLYEHAKEFAIQLVGTGSFDLRDQDWACDEIFSSGEDLFYLPHGIVGDRWEDGLEAAKSLVKNYLQHGSQAEFLKASRGVGVGFVDGDIEFACVTSRI